MNKQNRNRALFFLSVVVVASGCSHAATETGPAATTAVQVQNFSAVPGTIFDNQQTALRLSLKNVGDQEATAVGARLFNVPIGEREKREWEVDRQGFVFNTLKPADEDAGIPATPRVRTLTAVPPDLNNGETVPYDFIARILFKYKNRANTEIQLMSQDRFREAGGGRATPEVQNTDGPVHMEVRSRTPIVFYDNGRTSSDLCVIVRNEGTGTTFLGGPDNTDKVRLEIEAAGDIQFVPRGNQNPNVVDIIGSKGIKCYTIPEDSFDFSQRDIQKTIPITLTATYGYYKDTQTSVTVKGR